MKRIWTLLMLGAALINLAPVVGAALPGRMMDAYGIALDDPSLEILMRHRAVLFGVVGGLLLASIFWPGLRAAAYAAGSVSMISFLLIAWAVGDVSPPLQRVARVDVAGLVCLAGAIAVHAAWLRTERKDPAPTRPG